MMADYLDTVEDRPVFPPIEPGSLRALFIVELAHGGEDAFHEPAGGRVVDRLRH